METIALRRLPRLFGDRPLTRPCDMAVDFLVSRWRRTDGCSLIFTQGFIDSNCLQDATPPNCNNGLHSCGMHITLLARLNAFGEHQPSPGNHHSFTTTVNSRTEHPI